MLSPIVSDFLYHRPFLPLQLAAPAGQGQDKMAARDGGRAMVN